MNTKQTKSNRLLFIAAKLRHELPSQYEYRIVSIAKRCGLSIGDLQRETQAIIDAAGKAVRYE